MQKSIEDEISKMLDNARYGKRNEITRNLNEYTTENQHQMPQSPNVLLSYHHDNTRTDQSQASLCHRHDNTKSDQSQASRQFVPRSNTEPVKNCTKLDKELLDKIVQKVATELLSRSGRETDGRETNKHWNKGGMFNERALYRAWYLRGSDLNSTTATFNGLLTNQMRLLYPINQSDAFAISD
jgi:hypothetical protein